jgi:mono/diheme cytochrome c family protein
MPVEEQKTAVEETDPMKNKGVGPITSVTLGEIDQKMADEGKAIFTLKCTACHKISKRLVGPALAGVTERRTPEWIMNQILNPEEMVLKDPIAKKLLAEYIAPMANQGLTEAEARKILEYFRTKTSATDE